MGDDSTALPIWRRLPAAEGDAAARHRALEDTAALEWAPTDTVSYRSAGHVLLVGPAANVAEVAARLAGGLRVSVLADAPAPSALPAGVDWSVGAAQTLAGYLGAFRLHVAAGADRAAREAGPFDTVLDLGATPLNRVQVPPPGYFRARDAAALEAAIESLADLVGEFEKPRYFEYDASICAHGRSGIAGCTRCIDTCPTGAIISLRERIEVDPYLCQGGGVCAAACPTGAIRYTSPKAEQWLERLRRLLRVYREAGGQSPELLLHDAGTGAERVAAAASALPGHVLPLEVEEVGCSGMDSWLVALAYGSARVTLLVHEGVPASVRAELEQQVGYARGILAGLGYDEERIALVSAPEQAAAVTPAAQPFAGFGAVGTKRELLRMALAHLHEHAPAPVSVAPLPAGAPFGEIRVDKEACTLCMACVSVCPAGALAAGGNTPALRFVEWNCVQCGMCERACPEDAISRRARVLYEPSLQRERRTLNEDAPFLCVTCGKPFATQSMMRRMREKLAGHWMFQRPEQQRRLQMCEDCRVRDMFEHGEMSG